jgi:hypothetical protein
MWTGDEEFVLQVPTDMGTTKQNPLVALCATIKRIRLFHNNREVDEYWFDPSIMTLHSHIGCLGVTDTSDRKVKCALGTVLMPDVIAHITSFIGQELRFHLPLLQRFIAGPISALDAHFYLRIEWASEPCTIRVERRTWRIPAELRPTLYREWQWRKWPKCMSATEPYQQRLRLSFEFRADELFVSLPVRVHPASFQLRIDGYECMAWKHVKKIQRAICEDRRCYRLHLRLPISDERQSLLNFSQADNVSLDVLFQPADTADPFAIIVAASSYTVVSYDSRFDKKYTFRSSS